MNNSEKALIYEQCIRESDVLQRINSKIKSENAGNIPPHLQEQIYRNEAKIQQLVKKLESLFN